MNSLKTALAALAIGTLALSPAAAAEKGTVGISMPTKSSARWISDGQSMVKYFQEKGYKTDLQYAEDDIPNQLAQIENMITKGANVLVIAAIDGTTLSDALRKASPSTLKDVRCVVRDKDEFFYEVESHELAGGGPGKAA